MVESVIDSACARGSNRRRFLRDAAALGLSTYVDSLLPAYAREHDGLRSDARAPGEPIDLFLRRQEFKVGERIGQAVTLNGTVPGPLLRLFEGEDVTIRVHNELDESSSVSGARRRYRSSVSARASTRCAWAYGYAT